MYLQHFGLHSAPFAITPDTSFAVATRAQQEALATLLLAIDDGAGFIKITGEVGTGKTLTCRRFLAALAAHADRYDTAYIPNPCLTPRTLLLAVARELRLDVHDRTSEHALLAALNRALLDAAAAGRNVVVCLDEAQAMSFEALEALRLLSNLETEKRKLMQVVLFGQPELDAKLAQPHLRQLASRIAYQCRLDALTELETEHYVAHRLRVAGRTGDGGAGVFAAPVVARLHRVTRGVPRLINIVAHKALLAAYGEGAVRVGRRHLASAASDTPYARPATPLSRAAQWWRDWRTRRLARAGA
jgi:MSHA biogenesis protein MshM